MVPPAYYICFIRHFQIKRDIIHFIILLYFVNSGGRRFPGGIGRKSAAGLNGVSFSVLVYSVFCDIMKPVIDQSSFIEKAGVAKFHDTGTGSTFSRISI